MNQTHQQLLQLLDLPDLQPLGAGMQCQVFADGPEQVLKIYSQDAGIQNLKRLMDFYASLDRSNVNFHLPAIYSVEPVKDWILVREHRLHGTSPTLDHLQHMKVEELEIFFQHYVDVLFQIPKIGTLFLQPGEPLDQTGDFVSYGQFGSWQALLMTNLKRKLAAAGQQYLLYVEDLQSIVDAVEQQITTLPNNVNHLIHGDFYPANTLMDSDFNIQAVLDFGTYTLVGDPVYDLALGWIFADMYQNVKQLSANDYVGELIRERIPTNEYQRMKLYILIYSLLSADIYSDPGAPDGHFQWAMNNLNNDDFREVL